MNMISNDPLLNQHMEEDDIPPGLFKMPKTDGIPPPPPPPPPPLVPTSMSIEKVPVVQEKDNMISLRELMKASSDERDNHPPGMLPPPSTTTMDFVTKVGDSTLLEAPTIPPTSIRPASPLLSPTIPEEEVPPSLPKIIKPSLVSAFGFSVEDLTEIGDPFASPRRTKNKISEEQTRSEEPSQQQQQTLHKSSSEILILTPKLLPPPAPENVPIEAIPSAHGTILNPTEKIPDSFMKQLESLRESAKRRELALRREEEEARKRQLESTKTMTTEKESKTTSVPSTTVESETPYYEGLGLSSSLFSSPEKHDMEILMYNARLADEQQKQRRMRLNNIAMYNARLASEQQKQRERILNSNHVTEITKGIDADDQLLQRYLHLIQTAKNATGDDSGVVDSPPPSVKAENPSSPAMKTFVVAKTPLRKYREREYDRVAPATKLKTTTMRSSSPHIEEYASTPARQRRSKPRSLRSNETLETFLYAAAGLERESVREMLKVCPALNHMPVSRIRSVLEFLSGDLNMNRNKIRSILQNRPHLLCRPLNALRPALLNIRKRVRKSNDSRPPPPLHPPPPKEREDVEYEKQILRRRVQSLCARLLEKDKLEFVSDLLSLEEFKRTISDAMPSLTIQDINLLCAVADEQDSGSISVKRFLQFCETAAEIARVDDQSSFDVSSADGPFALTLIDAMSVWTEWQQDDIMTFDRFLKSLRSISRHAYPQHHPSFARNVEEDLDVSDISMFLLLYNSMLAVSASCARLETRTSSSDDDASQQQAVVSSLWYFFLYYSTRGTADPCKLECSQFLQLLSDSHLLNERRNKIVGFGRLEDTVPTISDDPETLRMLKLYLPALKHMHSAFVKSRDGGMCYRDFLALMRCLGVVPKLLSEREIRVVFVAVLPIPSGDLLSSAVMSMGPSSLSSLSSNELSFLAFLEALLACAATAYSDVRKIELRLERKAQLHDMFLHIYDNLQHHERRRLSTASSGETSSVLSSFSSLMRAATHPFLVVFAKQSGLLKRGRTRSGSFSSNSPGVSSYAGGDGS